MTLITSYRISEAPIYTFRVRILDCLAGYAPPDCREIQREIEIAANHTLADLADAIFHAYGFDNAHMWSFFLGSKRWGTANEYTRDPDANTRIDDFDTNALVRLLHRLAPLDGPLEEQFVQLRAFIDEFVPSFPRETRDRMRVYLSLPPSDAPPDSNEDIDDELVGAFLKGFDPEFLVAVEVILVSAPPEQLPALRMDFATQLRKDILGTLDMTDDADTVILTPDSSILSLASAFPMFPPDLFPERNSPAKDASTALIRDVPYPGKTGKQEFQFLFDYGDEWEFGVKLLKITPTKTPRARYPRVTARRGKSPRQYPPRSWYENDMPRGGIAIAVDPTTGAMIQQIIEIPAAPKPPRKQAQIRRRSTRCLDALTCRSYTHWYD